MNHTIKLALLTVCATYLSSCMMYDDSNRLSYQYRSFDTNQRYSPVYFSKDNYKYYDTYQYTQPKEVSVPDSYHVGTYHSPVSFKDRDKNWVSSQNPQGYTIEVADDAKASSVAQKLNKAPKNDRRAQIRYQKEGKEHYKGVYGSFDSQEAAQKALNELPAEMKQGAGVSSWSKVQGAMNE